MNILVYRMRRYRFLQRLNRLAVNRFFLGKGFIMGSNPFDQIVKDCRTGYGLCDFI